MRTESAEREHNGRQEHSIAQREAEGNGDASRAASRGGSKCSSQTFPIPFWRKKMLLFCPTCGSLLRTLLSKVDLPCAIAHPWTHSGSVAFGGRLGVPVLGENACFRTHKTGHRSQREFDGSNSNHEKRIEQFSKNSLSLHGLCGLGADQPVHSSQEHPPDDDCYQNGC